MKPCDALSGGGFGGGEPRGRSCQTAFSYAWPKPAVASLQEVISGGEAGADRAALDAARALGYKAGGWCRRSVQTGRLPGRLPLRETNSQRSPQSAGLNVRDADATLFLHTGRHEKGMRASEGMARRLGKPFLAIDLADRTGFDQAKAWLEATAPRVLNVVGARASHDVGTYARSFALLVRLLGARPR